jgi:hypothetical protein
LLQLTSKYLLGDGLVFLKESGEREQKPAHVLQLQNITPVSFLWGHGSLLKAKILHGHQVLVILLSGFTQKVVALLLEYGWLFHLKTQPLLFGLLTVMIQQSPLILCWI